MTDHKLRRVIDHLYELDAEGSIRHCGNLMCDSEGDSLQDAVDELNELAAKLGEMEAEIARLRNP